MLHAVAQRRDRGLGERGISDAGLAWPHDALELLDADLEAMIVGQRRARVEDVLLVLDVGHHR